MMFFLLATFLPASERPNVLFIAVDDLRPELGSYGTKAKTPNIDALANSGLQFNRAYCNQAVCGASRVSLMTGLYPEFTGERTYHVTDWRKRWEDVVTLNQHFLANDYNVVGLGKIYHGTGGPGVDPQNWSEWLRVTATQYASPESRKQIRVSRSSAPGGRDRRRGPATESADVPNDTYADGKRAVLGAEKLAELAKNEKPFFLAVGFTKPHLPFVAPKRFWDLYDRDDFSMPSNLGVPPGYPSYASNVNAGELRSYSDIPERISPSAFPASLNKRLIHGYYACVSYLDHNIGLLLNALAESGKADNTIVVFWADHGWKLGDHSSWCKHTNFECDTRVPLIIRVPGKHKDQHQTDALVELVDLFPTLCELSGLSMPAHLQGKSFVPTINNPKLSHRAFAYSSYPHGRRGAKPVVGHSIRTDRFRYTEWWERGSDLIVDSVLTDLAVDPGEITNVLNDNKDFAKQLSQRLRKRVTSVRKN